MNQPLPTLLLSLADCEAEAQEYQRDMCLELIQRGEKILGTPAPASDDAAFRFELGK